jgi:hypothetical protein
MVEPLILTHLVDVAAIQPEWLIPPQPEFAPRSPGWESLSVELRHNACCAFCAKTTNLEVHHVVPFHLKPALELDRRNLVVLCRWCHFVVGHFGRWDQFNPLVLFLIRAVAADVQSVMKDDRPTVASVVKLLQTSPIAEFGLQLHDVLPTANELFAV